MILNYISVRRRLVAVLASIFLVSGAVRLTVVSSTELRMSPDSFEYMKLARNIRTHGSFSIDTGPPFTPTIRRGPMFPLFLAVVGGEAISPTRIRVWQSALDSLVAVMICLLLWNRVRTRWVVLAGLLYALHPGAIFYSNKILSESFFGFLFTSATASLVLAIERGQLRWAGAAGVLLGMAALCRPIATPFVFVAVGLIYLSRNRIAKPARLSLIFAAATMLTMAPWLVRSSALAGRFVLVSATGPVNFALATTKGPWNLNDQASIFRGTYYWEVDPCGRDYSRAHTAVESALADQTCLRQGIANLRSDVGFYLRNRLRQLHFPLTSFDFVTDNPSSFGTAWAQRDYRVLGSKLVLYLLFAFAPLVCGLAGLILGPPTIEKRLSGAVWMFTILIYLPGFVEYRYFLPAVSLLLVSSAYGWHWIEGASRAAARRLQVAGRAWSA